VSKTDVVRAFSIVGPHEELRSKYKELYWIKTNFILKIKLINLVLQIIGVIKCLN
jgi:hypothetical protein